MFFLSDDLIRLIYIYIYYKCGLCRIRIVVAYTSVTEIRGDMCIYICSSRFLRKTHTFNWSLNVSVKPRSFKVECMQLLSWVVTDLVSGIVGWL